MNQLNALSNRVEYYAGLVREYLNQRDIGRQNHRWGEGWSL